MIFILLLYNIIKIMSKKIWVNKASSFMEANKFDEEYYLYLSPEERLSILQYLREKFWDINPGKKHESRKRLSRVLKIIKQTQG